MLYSKLATPYEKHLWQAIKKCGVGTEYELRKEFEDTKFFSSIGELLFDKGIPSHLFNENDFYFLAFCETYTFKLFNDTDYKKAANLLPPQKCGNFFVFLAKKYKVIWNAAQNEARTEIKFSSTSHVEREKIRIKTLNETHELCREYFFNLLSLIRKQPDTPIELLGELL